MDTFAPVALLNGVVADGEPNALLALAWSNYGHFTTLRVRDVCWIYFSNIVAILCTLGLAVPWAMIRLARYRAEHFTLVATGDLDEFVAASEMSAGATGAELVDALDAGFDFGI